jgi:uncharacterized protein
MTTLCVQFFVQEGMRHAGHPIHEWLFAEAKALGIPGGTAFRGRHGRHEDGFFELAGTLPENVSFFADEARIRGLLARVGEAGLQLVYVTYPVSVGITGT